MARLAMLLVALGLAGCRERSFDADFNAASNEIAARASALDNRLAEPCDDDRIGRGECMPETTANPTNGPDTINGPDQSNDARSVSKRVARQKANNQQSGDTE